MRHTKRYIPFLAAFIILCLPMQAFSINLMGGDRSTANDSERTGAKDVVDLLVQAGAFTTLVKAVKEAGLVNVLKGEGPFTVFAPTDGAFDRLPEGALEMVLNDVETLKSILTYHVVAGDVDANALADLAEVKTVQGESMNVRVNIASGAIWVNQANILQPDLNATNGTIHIIDQVLVPPKVAEGSQQAEVEARQNILATAEAAGNFETLLTAIEKTGLVEDLMDDAPKTVFAPTDAAFEKLPEGALEQLLQQPEVLRDILLYHVVLGKHSAERLVEKQIATPLNGSFIGFYGLGRDVLVNEALVLDADIECTNGVIHVLDSVLLPPEFTEGSHSATQ